MPTRSAPALVAVAVALALTTGACGADQKATVAKKTSSVAECQAQWHDVATSVMGLDQDTHPSSLASRWTSVLATVDYYEKSTSATDCQKNIEAQVDAIGVLRDFSDKVRVFDMAYQRDEVRAAADLYLSDPLPTPVPGANGKKVPPPSKAAVAAALAVLEQGADTANADLQPGWAQLASVELTDQTAIDAALQDLTFLTQDSGTWRRCQAALEVLAAAIKLQQGSTG